jgi:hypothetical protein
MYCITLHLHKQIIVIIYRSLFLLLFVSLLLYPFSLAQEQEVWHENLVPWRAGGRVRRRCRRTRVSGLHSGVDQSLAEVCT